MTEERPWGTYEILLDTDYCKVKRIIVNTGEQLSYQYHNHRNEVWVIVKGDAQITLNNNITNHYYGDIINIPKLTKHTVKNIGIEELIFIETQYGESFNESDIIRLNDKYGRVDYE